MPIKFSPSQKKYNKNNRKKFSIEHDYIKQKPTQDLIKYINEGNKPKLKRKCRVELDRRGVKLVWVPKTLN
jgi:HD superfamily phosphohydrolase YqeK